MHSVGVVTSNAALCFDANSSVYMASACCELLHYRNAAVLVGVVQAVGAVLWTVAAAVLYVRHPSAIDTAFAAVTVALSLLTLFTVLLLLVGVLTERPTLLWPQMLLLVGVIGCGIAMTVVAVVSMAGTGWPETVFSLAFDLETLQNTLGPIWPFCLAVIFDFAAAVGIWFYILVRGCYDYLLDKKFFEQNPNGTAGVTPADTKIVAVTDASAGKTM